MAREAGLFPASRSTVGQSTSDPHFAGFPERGFAANDSSDGQLACTDPAEMHQCHFSVFHAESVSVTSTRLAGGDWRWCLSDQQGTILVEAAGYRSEADCREAVAILQARSARATVA